MKDDRTIFEEMVNCLNMSVEVGGASDLMILKHVRRRTMICLDILTCESVLKCLLVKFGGIMTLVTCESF